MTLKPQPNTQFKITHLARVDAHMNGGSIGLLTLHTLNVDDVFLPVYLDNFANLLAFVVSPDHLFKNKDVKHQYSCLVHENYNCPSLYQCLV